MTMWCSRSAGAACSKATRIPAAAKSRFVCWCATKHANASKRQILFSIARARTRSTANVEFHPGAVVEAIEFLGQDRGFRVSARTPEKNRTWDVDRIIGNVGYTPDTNLYRELQVHECYASLGPMKLAAALAGSK